MAGVCACNSQPSDFRERAEAHGLLDDPAIFRVRVGDTQLEIPKKYIHANGVSTWGTKPIVRGQADEVWLGALLPDFLSSEDQKAKLSTESVVERQVTIRLYRVDAESNAAELSEKHFRATSWRKISALADIGLKEYDRSSNSWGSLSYVPIDSEYRTLDGRELIFSCLRYDVTKNAALQCKTHYKLAPTTGLDYRFDWGQLKKWKDIDQGVRRLLNTFRESAS
jgi:hypothetical protein